MLPSLHYYYIDMRDNVPSSMTSEKKRKFSWMGGERSSPFDPEMAPSVAKNWIRKPMSTTTMPHVVV